jgi:hypothetical protein
MAAQKEMGEEAVLQYMDVLMEVWEPMVDKVVLLFLDSRMVETLELMAYLELQEKTVQRLEETLELLERAVLLLQAKVERAAMVA